MQLPALDALRLEMIMHRDAHFSGSSEMMLDYYRQGGVGTMPDFSIEMVEEMHQLEKERDLSELLPEAAQAEVRDAKERYAALKSVYDKEEELPRLLSDLILTEEEEPTGEKEALVACGTRALEPLFDLLRSETFYNPLYPGYGRTPLFAADVVAHIGDAKAIPHLFEALGHDNFFTDEAIITALATFGEEAKNFLIDRLTAQPLSRDNDRAAIALGHFEGDEEVAKHAFDLLKDRDVRTRPSLAPYLIFACAGLPRELRPKFLAFAKSGVMPASLQIDINAICKTFNSK